MTDAVAQDAMERAIAIDAIADQELSAADQINVNNRAVARQSKTYCDLNEGESGKPDHIARRLSVRRTPR
jgi:hypothetical protein